jgi:hypothetical protein
MCEIGDRGRLVNEARRRLLPNVAAECALAL